MQTILGAGGAIGVELARILNDYTQDIRLVSRNPKKINESDQLFSADLLDENQVDEAVAGSDVCYVTVGFEYKTRVWNEKWPKLIRNVVSACIKHQAKLVFFDNIYCLDKQHLNPITEESPTNPPSEKGKVRAWVDHHIMDNVENGKLKAIIARSPDFFGPVKENSVLMNLVYENLVKGKKAQWFCNADVVHSFGFTPDLAKGTAMLGNDPDAYNQVWNLPVDPEPITGKEWVQLFARELGTSDKVSALPKWAVQLLGIFIPILRESAEMLYQYDRDYLFDSSKFNTKYSYTPTTNQDAVKKTLEMINGND